MFDFAVAPLAGAWIEIHHIFVCHFLWSVAPLAGAWIEISIEQALQHAIVSLPSRERGLKSQTSSQQIHSSRRSPRGSVD